MVKRLLTIPLVIIFTIAVFTCSVLGANLPSNVYDLPFTVTVNYTVDGVSNFLTLPSFYSGSSFYYRFTYDKGYFNFDSFTQNLLIDISDGSCVSFYVCIRDASYNGDFYNISSNLLKYRNTAKEYDYKFDVLYTDLVTVYPSTNTYKISSSVEQVTDKSVHFFYFENVPAGTYFVSDERYYYTSMFGVYVDEFIAAPEPEPDPVPPSVLLSDLGSVVTSGLGWVSQSVDTIVSNPFLLLITGFLCLGAAVSFLSRLLSRS